MEVRERVEEVIFDYYMADSVFTFVKVVTKAGEDIYQFRETMNDGTEVFREAVEHGPRILTILQRIKEQR